MNNFKIQNVIEKETKSQKLKQQDKDNKWYPHLSSDFDSEGEKKIEIYALGN
jgi:hypothetical protein